jgi:SAM-dependent methyltransferase
MSDEITWADYYRENEGREPRGMLLEVLGAFERPGEAVDVGCGAGIDTLAMLERGWRVFAPDEDISAFSKTQARDLFEGWRLDRFEEEENDGDACDGPKHWHVFHAVATAPAS